MPDNNTNNVNDSPLDLWLDSARTERSEDQQDWPSPMPESYLPNWIKAGYNNSITGLATQITTGKQAFKISEKYDPNMAEDVAATLVSFFMPADMAIFAGGGGIGGTVLKASTKQAMKAMVKSGMKKGIAESAAERGAMQFAKRAAFDKRAVMKHAASKQAGALGFYSGVQNAQLQKIQSGDIKFMDTLEATAKGAVLGGVTGGIGGKVATTAMSPTAKFATRLPAETAAFGTIGPLMEGHAPTPDDYIHAAGVIGAMGGLAKIGRGTKNKWGEIKNYIEGDVKKRQMSSDRLNKEAEARTRDEIGSDIWTDGKTDVIITKDWSTKDRRTVLNLKDTKSGETFPMGKNDFFFGSKNQNGDVISKPFRRRAIAGEKLKYKKGVDPDNIVLNRIFGLKKKFKVSDDALKNMVDAELGRTQEPKYDSKKRLKSGLGEADSLVKHKVLENLVAKQKIGEVRNKMVELGQNEVYYLDSQLKNNYPKVYENYQRIASSWKTSKTQMSKHPVGRRAAKLMINTDSRIGALTGKYFTALENVKIGGKTKLGRDRKFFNLTEKEAMELAKDLERPVPKLSYTKDVKKLFDVMYSMAEKSGVPVRDKIENYFPQVIKEDVLKILFKDVDKMVNSSQGNILSSDRLAEKQGVEAQLRAMVSDPKALKPETIKALEYLKDKTGSYSTAFEQLRKGINSERYTINKHLEKGRELDLPNELLMRDARVVVPEYIQRWAKRLGYVESFGVQGEKMFGDINAMQSSGFHREANVLRDTFESFTNLAETNPARNYRPAIKNFWNSFVNFGIATKIGTGFATLPNLSQPLISSALLAGIPRTTLGLFKYYTDPKYKQFIKESGAMTTSQAVNQLVAGYNPTSGTKMGNIANWMTKYWGLTIPYYTFKGLNLKEIRTKPWELLTKRVKGMPVLTFQSINKFNQTVSAVSGFEAMNKWKRWANGEGFGGLNERNRMRSIEHLNDMGLIKNYDRHHRDMRNNKITVNEFFNRTTRELNSTLKSEQRQREGIYRFAIDSQLQRNILREPVYFNDPKFRPFILFKRFGYRQFEYIFKNTAREWNAGNAGYFLRLMAGGLVAGPLLNSAKRGLRDWIAGENVYDENYSLTEVNEDYENIRAEMEKNGYSIDTFFDAASKNISVGDLWDSFSTVGVFGFVGDVSQAIYEGEKEFLRAAEFFLKPAVLQDMMVGIDTATKLLVESHEYGPQNAFKRVPKTLAPAFGSQARALSKRYWTPKQIEDYQKYRKGGIRSKILDAFLEGDQKQGDRLIKAWNRANPDNLFDYNDINWKEMYKRAVRKAKKRMNP
tara:strand:- start:558 stop:4466 length:3909 start_codon:yes stop_codon:yes gene_type:complete